MAPFGIPLEDRPLPFGHPYAPPGIVHLPPPPLRVVVVDRPPGLWVRVPCPVVGIPGFYVLRDAWGVDHPPPPEEWIPLWRGSRPDPQPNPWATP